MEVILDNLGGLNVITRVPKGWKREAEDSEKEM